MAALFPSAFRRFWETDRGLPLLLALLVTILFVLPLFPPAGAFTRLGFDIALSMLLVAGVGAAASGNRMLRSILTAIVVASLVLRRLEWILPSGILDALAGVAGLLSTGILAGVVMARAVRSGRITGARILGAVAVYLLLGLTWAQAYVLLSRIAPDAFQGGAAEAGSPYAFFYYSVVTLTTVGYGDITPVHPVARSLAMLEALTGQLYPAILLARLVSLEIAGRDPR